MKFHYYRYYFRRRFRKF